MKVYRYGACRDKGDTLIMTNSDHPSVESDGTTAVVRFTALKQSIENLSGKYTVCVDLDPSDIGRLAEGIVFKTIREPESLEHLQTQLAPHREAIFMLAAIAHGCVPKQRSTIS